MAKHLYRVNRHMVGDQPYAPGDQRQLEPNEAAHMVRSGALTDLGPAKAAAEKAEPELKNKAEPKATDKAAAKPADKPEDA